MTFGQQAGTVSARPLRSRRGFSILELLIVMAILAITSVIAIPIVQNVSTYFTMHGAVSSLTGAIQSTRYQAIFQGCPYQIVIDNVANTYQVQGEPYSAGTGSCAAAWTNICAPGLATCPIPLSGSGNAVTIGAAATLQMSPGGRVQGCPCTLTMTYGTRSATIVVSSYGNTNVTYTP